MKAKLLITKGRIMSINLKNLIKFANKDKTNKNLLLLKIIKIFINRVIQCSNRFHYKQVVRKIKKY